MACPYAAVFRLSAPLVAHSCIRLAIRSGQSHPVSWTQAQPSDWDRIATALSGSGHSTAKEEHAPSVTLPPTSPHAIVWCGDTPVLQSPDDRRERGKRKPRLGPMPASQPQRLHQSEPRDSQQARGVPGQRDGRSAASTVCHETPQNATIWPFLLAISEIGCTPPPPTKYHLESGLNQRDEGAHGFFVIQVPVVPRSKTSTGGVLCSRRESLSAYYYFTPPPARQ